MSSNYPPGVSGRPSEAYPVFVRCLNGHERMVFMYNELGGAFFVSESEDIVDSGCRICVTDYDSDEYGNTLTFEEPITAGGREALRQYAETEAKREAQMFEGTEGQDRKSYTDTQDRDSYTVSSE